MVVTGLRSGCRSGNQWGGSKLARMMASKPGIHMAIDCQCGGRIRHGRGVEAVKQCNWEDLLARST